MINFKIKNTICLGKKSDSSLNLNDHEQNQNDKIEVLVNLFADLRDQIDDLNRKLKASEDKAMSLENKIAELKTEKEIQIEALTERLKKLEEKSNDSNKNLSQLKVDVEQQKQHQNKTCIEKMKSINEKFSSISDSVNELNETLVSNYIKKTTMTPTATTVKKSKLLKSSKIKMLKKIKLKIIYNIIKSIQVLLGFILVNTLNIKDACKINYLNIFK